MLQVLLLRILGFSHRSYILLYNLWKPEEVSNIMELEQAGEDQYNLIEHSFGELCFTMCIF